MKIRSALLVAMFAASFLAVSVTSAHADSSTYLALFTTPFKSDTGNGVIKEPPSKYGEDSSWDALIRHLVDIQKKTSHSNPKIAALMAQYMKLKEDEKRFADEALAACQKAFLPPTKCANAVAGAISPGIRR